MIVLITACSTVESENSELPVPEQSVTTDIQVPAENNLSDLSSMTFACPKAALNAAAREAKKVPSQGSYQFSFYRITRNSHHAQYEVHFKSNVVDEPELKYCVSIYCQQGWNPATSKTTVQLIDDSVQDVKTPDSDLTCSY